MNKHACLHSIKTKNVQNHCDQCESSFNRSSGLKVHIFKCIQCDESFGQKGHLTQHIKGAHKNAFVCPTCNKVVASKQRLRAS